MSRCCSGAQQAGSIDAKSNDYRAELRRRLTDAIEANGDRCPSCRGEGMVTKFVPNEHEGPCSTCNGSGKWVG